MRRCDMVDFGDGGSRSALQPQLFNMISSSRFWLPEMSHRGGCEAAESAARPVAAFADARLAKHHERALEL